MLAGAFAPADRCNCIVGLRAQELDMQPDALIDRAVVVITTRVTHRNCEQRRSLTWLAGTPIGLLNVSQKTGRDDSTTRNLADEFPNPCDLGLRDGARIVAMNIAGRRYVCRAFVHVAVSGEVFWCAQLLRAT